MVIKHLQHDHHGSFYIENDGMMLAEMTYSMSGTSLMIIDHTEVSETLRGKNAGYQLVHAAVEFARANQVRIFPCAPSQNRYSIKMALHSAMCSEQHEDKRID